MIKKIIIAIVLLTSVLIAQDETKRTTNVELPDFIIMGIDIISVKKVNKMSPDFISTISDEFLRPTFSPEELEIRDLSNPIKSDLNLLDSVSSFKGNIEAGVGLYTIPKIKGTYAYPFNNGIVEGVFSGNYNRAYDIEYSDRYSLSLGGNFVYWSDIDNNFLPGTQSNISADIGTTSFKLFAANDPRTKRTISSGNLLVGLRNNFGKNFQFGFTLSDHVTSLSEENFDDNYFRLKGESKIVVSIVNIGIAADYQKHYIKNSFGDKQGRDIFIFRPVAGFQFTELIKGAFGFTLANSAGKNLSALYASVGIKLNKNLTVFGEYAPVPQLVSPGTMLRENEYFNAVDYSSIYYEKSDYYDIALKYEYGPYYQINGGLRYFSSKDYPYFMNSADTGKFDLGYTKMTSFNPYLNLLYHLGPFGKFYGSVDLSFAKTNLDTLNKFVSYHPVLNATGMYGYHFAMGLETQVKLTYHSKSYADLKNELVIDPFIDLGLNFIYSLKPNFDLTLKLSNLLSNSNYRWYNYKEMPLNVIFGINYRL
ncbi:MAG: hypothetical protein MUO34_09660 [Ignavibacteriaceae bacterium]|nr:hypothetical protein [Ignavibacteriaceae bacterium]